MGNNLGLLCAAFIFADAVGYHEISTWWLVGCWIVVLVSGQTAAINNNIKRGK